MPVKLPTPRFAPDQANENPKFTAVARNVVPSEEGFSPFNIISPFTLAAPSQIYGFEPFKVAAGSYKLIAGTADKLLIYEPGGQTWDDISSASYDLPNPESWGMAQFGPFAIATNENNAMQTMNLNTETVFSDLGGSPPRCRKVITVGDFLVALGLTDDSRAIAWCGVRNPDFWTYGERGSDFNTFKEGGEVMGGTSSMTGALIFQEKIIRRMVFEPGSTYTFSFPIVSKGNGLVARDAIVQVAGTTYYLDEDGFYRISPGGLPEPIGKGRVDKYFQDNVDQTQLKAVQASADPIRKTVYFRYMSNDNGNATSTDRVLAYDWHLNEWSDMEFDLTWMNSAATTATTLEQLDTLYGSIDAVPFSLDSRVWKGGRPTLIGFDRDNKMGFFDGETAEATVETGSINLISGRRSMVNGFRIATESPDVVAQLGTSERHGGAVTWRSEVGLSPRRQKTLARAGGRFHKVRVRIPQGSAWEHLTGITDFEVKDDGE